MSNPNERHLIGRGIVRRFVRRRGRAGHIAWTGLASVWVHLAALVLVAVVPTGLTPFSPAGSTLHFVRHTPGVAQGEWLVDDAEARMALPGRPPSSSPTDAPHDVQAVRTQAEDAVAQAPQAQVISAHHTISTDPRRAEVTSERAGPSTLRSDGDGDGGGRRSVAQRSGEDSSARGNAPQHRSEAVVVVGAGGGGRAGDATGAGDRSRGGIRTAGGPAAPQAVGGASVRSDPRGGPVAPQRAARQAPNGSRALAEAPAWWRPAAVRVQAPKHTVAPTLGASSLHPVGADGLAVADRPGSARSVGGASQEAAALALPSEGEAEVGLPRVAHPGTSDPVEELRRDLGFGPFDRDELRPRPAWAGARGGTGQADSSPQSALDAVPIDWQTSLSTIGTTLGAYVQRAEALIDRRWRSHDLAPQHRASGVQGQVTVRYVIQPGGRVSDVRVKQSSGNLQLDRMAANAIPGRLPRLPPELADRPLHHQVTLRYRNPVVGSFPLSMGRVDRTVEVGR